MGKPTLANPGVSPSEFIGGRRQRGEVNHLSTHRNRKQVSDSASSGERTRNSLNRLGLLSRGRGTRHNGVDDQRKCVEKHTIERDSRVREDLNLQLGTRVMRDTRNLA